MRGIDGNALRAHRTARCRETGSAPHPGRQRGDGAGRRAGEKGLTLIEILVAVALLGLLSAGIVTALEVAARSWEDARSRLTADRRIASANQIFHSLFTGIVRIEAETPPRAETGPQRFLFFQGEPGAMRFVTSYSASGGYRAGLQITELRLLEGPTGMRILLNQMPYLGPRSAGMLVDGFAQGSGVRRPVFRPIEARANSLILADEIEGVRFSYLAPRVRRGQPAVWTAEWVDGRILPGAITVRLTPKNDLARLRPVDITTLVRAEGWLWSTSR